jgi:tetratricopeptide (TPR) repeat protein
LANTLIALEQFDEALLSCNKAIQLQADYPLAYSTKGALLQKLNRAAEALENYSTAISMSPASAEFYYNRANAHKQMEDFELAIHDYFQAIAYRANFPEAHLNCGDSYLNQGKLAHAIRHFDEAISLRPHYAQANWAKSIALLLSGDFEHGLPLHEWRWKLNEKDDDWHNFAKPVWDGTQELHGKTILAYFSPSWTAFQADGGRDFSVIVDGISN